MAGADVPQGQLDGDKMGISSPVLGPALMLLTAPSGGGCHTNGG